MKRIFLLTAILGILIPKIAIGEVILTDEEKYKIDIKPKKVEEGIKTGHLIMFGRYIEPPYEIKIESDRILINGILLYPRPARPKKPGTDEVEAFEDICRTKHFEWKLAHGRAKAKEMFMDFLRKEPFVKEIVKEEKPFIILYYSNELKGKIMYNFAPKNEYEKRENTRYSMYDKYRELRANHTEEEAIQLTIEFLRKQEVVEDIKINPIKREIYKDPEFINKLEKLGDKDLDKRIGGRWILYKGEDEFEGLGVGDYIMKFKKKTEAEEQTELKNIWLSGTKERTKDIIKYLKAGYLIVVHGIYSEIGAYEKQYENPDQMLSAIKCIMYKNITDAEKEKQLIENIDWKTFYKYPYESYAEPIIVKEIIHNFK